MTSVSSTRLYELTYSFSFLYRVDYVTDAAIFEGS